MTDDPRVRVGVLGWNRDHAALTKDQAAESLNVAWIEVGGVRIPGRVICQASWHAGQNEFATTTVEFYGTLDVVPVDNDGVTLP